MASKSARAVGGALRTLPAQLRMASVPLKFFPWLVCSVHITPDLFHPPHPILGLFMPGAPS